MECRKNNIYLVLVLLFFTTSCNSVKSNCSRLLLYRDSVTIESKQLLPCKWDCMYYFDYSDRDYISSVLCIPYTKEDYVDVGCRFIFLKDKRIVHQEIYWDESFYRSRIPTFFLQQNQYQSISNSDSVIIKKEGGNFVIYPLVSPLSITR